MKKHVSVSVIIPTLNGLLESDHVLVSLERQSYLGNISEVIIVDDASKNPQKKALYEAMEHQHPRLHISVLYHEKNTGPGGARNTGIKKATGEVIFFTDDDCELPSNWIEGHLKIYENHPTVSSVGGWYKPFNKDIEQSLVETFLFIHYLNTFGPWLYSSQGYSHFYKNFPAINTANLSVRRYVFNRVQFDEDFIAPGFEDQFFSEQIRAAGYIMYYIPLFVFHTGLTFREFLKLCRNRGMGCYVYEKKYGMRISPSAYSVGMSNLIHELSVYSPQLKQRKWRLLALATLRVFFVHSWVMRYHYERVYLKKMGHYPKILR